MQDSGIDLEAEERALLGTMKPAEAPSRQVAAVPDESFLNEGPLMHKVRSLRFPSPMVYEQKFSSTLSRCKGEVCLEEEVRASSQRLRLKGTGSEA